MKAKKIELNILVFILIEAFFLLFFFKTSLINIVIGTIMGIIISIFINKIKINKIIQILLLIASIYLLIITTSQIIDFITHNILKNYLNVIITITFLITSYLLANKGYHAYIKAIEIIFYFFLIIKLFSTILLLPNINTDNLNYQLLNELTISKSIIFISLIILFINISLNYLTKYTNNTKTFIISIINPVIIKILTISILGTTLLNIYKYPYFSVLKRIKYLEFIERMEGILSFEYLLTFIFLTSYIIILIKDLLIKLFYANK